jgi:alkanesulfonate monooxygenase SsuD/methylene tetrahydromethanopterin reductase-like flavin-dependent oxidoreductase (luciferase family)
MRAPPFAGDPADRYEAALKMCEWADQHRFDFVRLNEHHGSEDGYLPSPLALAAAVGARTSRLRIRITVLVLPLHDPLRVAEDCAVVDLISHGRLELVVAGGYRRAEFKMFGRDLRRRGILVEEGIATLRAAWTGESFLYRGRNVRVTPRPYRPGGPPICLGGSSAAAARRAAQIADGFEPTTDDFNEEYRAERARITGRDEGPLPKRFPLSFLMVANDTEDAWGRVSESLLHDMNSYARWTVEEAMSNYVPVADVGELRATGRYEIMTPRDCVAWVGRYRPATLELQPLLGGIDAKTGWESLRLLTGEVLPALDEEPSQVAFGDANDL